MKNVRSCHLPWDERNPYNALLGKALQKNGVSVAPGGASVWITKTIRAAGGVDVAHFHWIEAYTQANGLAKTILKRSIFLLQIAYLNTIGVKVFWTLHNLLPHDSAHPRLDRITFKCFGRLCHGIICHCDYAKKEACVLHGFNPSRVHVVPHGNYIDSYPNMADRLESRTRLGFDTNHRVFGFVGSLRAYKGLNQLLDAFHQLDLPDARLLIAGRLSDERDRDTLTQRVKRDPRVTLDEGSVPDEAMQYYFNAVDAVVLPFTKVLTSGSMILAMSFRKAVVVPRVGCLTETAEGHGAYFFGGDTGKTLGDALKQAAEASDAELSGAGLSNLEKIDRCSWDRIARRTAGLYRST